MDKSLELLNNIIALLSKSKNAKIIERYKGDIKWLEDRKIKWDKNKIRVGIIGITSSGKSTLINAILGKEILSAAVVPSTNRMTSCFYGDKDCVKIHFIDSDSKKLNDFSKIKHYTDEVFNKNNERKVDFVEIYTNSFDLNKDIELIDTPGLDAYGLEEHQKLTLDIILPTVDSCIYVSTLKTNSDESSMEILNKISEYKYPLIAVQNMLDSVKASIDNKKSKEKVAEELKNRFIKIINKSNISDKSSINIYQLSAKNVLKQKIKNKGIDKNYSQFIDGVNKIVSVKKPYIENERILSILNKFEKLIIQERKYLNNSNGEITFEYEGCIENIHKESDLLEKDIDNIFDNFAYLPSKYKDSSNINNIIEEVKKSASNFQKSIIDRTNKYQDFLFSLSDRLGISKRDVVFRPVNVEEYNINIQRKEKFKHKFEEKSGFINSIKRKIGSMLGKDWGYERIKLIEKVIDKKATEKKIEDYINKIKLVYHQSIQKLYNQFNNINSNLEDALINEKKSFEDKKKEIKDKKELKNIIDELKIILNKYKVQKQSLYNNGDIEIKDSKNNIGTEEFEIDNYLYNIYLLSQNIIFDINNRIMHSLFEYLKINKINSIIVGWDKNNLEAFANRFWNIKKTIDYSKTNRIISISEKQYIPDIIIKHKDIKIDKNYEVVYLMFSAIEIGYSKKLIFKNSDILNNINSFLFLVVEDFDSLEITTENINAIFDFKEELLKHLEYEIKSRIFILVNSENPIYNLLFIECQLNPCKNINDEIKLKKEITDKYANFIDKNTEDNIAKILKII